MFWVTEVQIEYQKNPLGLDEKKPRISWKLNANNRNFIQSAYQIEAGTKKGSADAWDSGIVTSADSTGVYYEGEKLLPCTRYFLKVTVWDEKEKMAVNEDAWFETGLLDSSIQAWEGAGWIGAPEKYLSADTIGVFVLRSSFQIEEGGTSAGIVFGAKDARLLDSRKNQYEIAGENYIRYEINVEEEPANLKIYRVGYHPEDSNDKPLATVPLIGDGKSVLDRENRFRKHELKIEVTGNCAYAYVDGIRVDEVQKEDPWGISTGPRQLNPLGDNDITTFPRLNQVGYYAGPKTCVHFDGISIENLRTPARKIVGLDEEKGILLEGGTEGKQITKDPSVHSLPMFRREFEVAHGGQIASARLYITARGIYDCSINGMPVTDTYFNPGHTQYDRHIVYQTYDVTEKLQEGRNGIGVTLASGWWCDSQTFALSNYNYYGDQEAFLAKLVVSYQNGETDTYVSNTSDWDYYGEGPYLYSGLFQGEHQDGRILSEYLDFSRADATRVKMEKPVEVIPTAIPAHRTFPGGFGREWPAVDHENTQIVGGIHAPVVEVKRLHAISMTQPRQGLFIYDLGQEMAGIPVIRLHGEEGTLVTIRYGEMLYPELPEYGNLHGLMLTENYRDAESIDKYILRGDAEGEIFTPKFTFHGYRYIEISGVDKAPDLSEVESIQLSSVSKMSGKLETSNKLLNRFIENVRWSQLCNFISIPTDCPQRNERMGWAGDTHVFCRTATFQSDVRLFYYRYLQALSDLQEKSGQLPAIAPVGGGFGGITYESAMILIVWELYQQYGDREVIRRFYPAMRKWCDFIKDQGMPGTEYKDALGDWLAPVETDLSLLCNAFYGHDMELMRKMAQVLGDEKEAAYFAKLETEAKEFWNAHFVDAVTGMTKDAEGNVCDTQCSYALPLAYNMFAEPNRTQAFEHLARKTKEAGEVIHTGFFGTGVLNPMLSAGGHTDLAYHLIQQTAYPSWLYPVTQGATTIWERWNSYTVENGFGGNNSMNSFNHYSLGSVLSWIYETVLGIMRDEEKPGYQHFYLKPAMQELECATGGFETGYGRINSSWKREENRYIYECDIPCNTSATLELKGKTKTICEELGSGHYQFIVE